MTTDKQDNLRQDNSLELSNTYQNLCDTVGLKPILGCTAYDILSEDEADAYCDDYCGQCKYHGDIYPSATAEQRERLEELILSNVFDVDIVKHPSTKQYKYYIGLKPNSNDIQSDWFDTRPDALYALTQKLRNEGVLNDEEVKEALCKK